MTTNLTKYRETLTSPELKKRFESNNSDEKNLKLSEEITHAELAARNNPKLMECDPESIMIAVANVSLTGLSLNKTLNQAYLVPRYDKQKGKMMAVLDPGYQGYITKMVDLGVAKQVYAHVVYENDFFDMDFGTDKKLSHKPFYLGGFTDKGAEVGAYAVAVLPDGTKKFEFLHITRINDIASTAKTKFMWNGIHREEMLKKTVVKYLWKYMPKNATKGVQDFAKIVETDNESNFEVEEQDTSEIIDVQTESGEKVAIQTKEAVVPEIKAVTSGTLNVKITDINKAKITDEGLISQAKIEVHNVKSFDKPITEKEYKEEVEHLKAEGEFKPVEMPEMGTFCENVKSDRLEKLAKFILDVEETDKLNTSKVKDGSRRKTWSNSIAMELVTRWDITGDNFNKCAVEAFGDKFKNIKMSDFCKKAPVDKIEKLILTKLNMES